MKRLAIITGASQGLGLETARQLSSIDVQVILTGRDATALKTASEGVYRSDWQVLDVSEADSVAAFFEWLETTHGRLDVLVNNAGRVYGGHGADLTKTDPDVVLDAVSNNSVGALRMMQHALPIMARGGYGRVVNVSSGMGAMSDMGAGAAPYRVSKAALNALTQLAAHEAPPGVLVNAVCPGWVRTEMGGPNATRALPEGAKGIVWAATLPPDGHNGGFFRDGAPIAW